MQERFQAALALTAQVSIERVIVTSVSRRDTETQLAVNFEIAADDSAAAEAIRVLVSLDSLNTNLMVHGLPRASSVMTTVADAGSQSSSGPSSLWLPAILGGSIGSFVFLLASTVGGYLLLQKLRRHVARCAFLKAVRSAEPHQDASDTHLPPDDENAAKSGSARPRKQYTALRVLGKGVRGCVVSATRKSLQGAPVAIKIVVPRKQKFDAAERRQLEREAALLGRLTLRGCRSAVHRDLAEASDPPQRDDVRWFVMEALDGESVEAELRPGLAGVSGTTPVGVSACIQAARDVLAALKAVHSEGFVHCGVAPCNIIHFAKVQDCVYQYKLVDFGKAREMDEIFEGDAADTPGLAAAYSAPELFSRSRVTREADIWSLGATMFELVSGCLPFASSSKARAAAIRSGTEGSAPDVASCLSEGQRQSFDNGLGRVIAKALEQQQGSRLAPDRLEHSMLIRPLSLFLLFPANIATDKFYLSG